MRVAEHELEIREKAVEERERMLAADVRMKFGESLAAVSKLGFADEIPDPHCRRRIQAGQALA